MSKRKVMSNGEQKDTIHAAVEIAGPDSGASVDKIRDILFGSQIKNYEARFARLEENLVRETVELKETMRRRFESLEGFFKSETEALAARLKAEREERTSAFHSLEQELKSIHDASGPEDPRTRCLDRRVGQRFAQRADGGVAEAARRDRPAA